MARRPSRAAPHPPSAVAYWMLGVFAQSDDAVHDAWLRLNRSDANDIENLGGWLTTVAARVSLAAREGCRGACR